MIQDFFINTAVIKKRSSSISYTDGISKKTYTEQQTPIKCRISHLSYKDLQLLSDTDDVQRKVMKMYASASVQIDEKDLITWDNKDWKVIAHYQPQDKTKIHHNKYFIKIVE